MGMSVSNLWAMKKYYVRFHLSDPKLQRSVGVLPWRHINQLMTKLKDDDNAIQYYAERTIEKGWNCDLLVNAIKLEMHKHQPENNASNNFAVALPEAQAAYANEVFKDSYCMGFLGVTEPLLELELERRLVEKVKQFLLELGQGFTYIGNQHVLSYNGKDYKVDMLFFHRGLRSLVAVDLKISEFMPEYISKMNLYLSLLDRLERGKDENPSIGIILCAEKDNVEVELALEGNIRPIGDKTDSETALQSIIAPAIKAYGWNSPEANAIINQTCGHSKFAMMHNGEVLLFGQFIHSLDGCYYSNYRFMGYQPTIMQKPFTGYQI